MKNIVGVWQNEDATVFKLRETSNYHTSGEHRGQHQLANEYHFRITCSNQFNNASESLVLEQSLAKRIVDLLNADDLRLAQEKKSDSTEVCLHFLIFSRNSETFYNDRSATWHSNPEHATWYGNSSDAYSKAQTLFQQQVDQLVVLRSDASEVSDGQYGS